MKLTQKAIELISEKYDCTSMVKLSPKSRKAFHYYEDPNNRILLVCPLNALFDSAYEDIRVAILQHSCVRGFTWNFENEKPTAVFVLSHEMEDNKPVRKMAGELVTDEEGLPQLVEKLDLFLTNTKMDTDRFGCWNEASSDFWESLETKKPISSWFVNKGFEIYVQHGFDEQGLGYVTAQFSPFEGCTKLCFAEEKRQIQAYLLFNSEITRLYARYFGDRSLEKLLDEIRIPYFLTATDKRLRTVSDIVINLIERELATESNEDLQDEISVRLHLPRTVITKDSVTLIPIVEMPAKLSREEELALFEQYRQMAWQQAHKYLRKSKEFHEIKDSAILEETKQAAEFGLWKAVAAFAPRKGYQFSTFAHKVIVSQVIHFLRNETEYYKGTDGEKQTDKNENEVEPDVVDNHGEAFIRQLEVDEYLRHLPLVVSVGLESLKYDPKFKIRDLMTAVGISQSEMSHVIRNI
jgi:RNA polymerase sigma factor (sigma-70 family)